MLRELFNNDEWALLKHQNEELCEKAGSLPEEVPLYNIQSVYQPDAGNDYVNHQNDS